MSDQDNLRDRIADILSRTYTSGPAKVVLEDIAAAQAIIDELGLRVEGQMGVDGEDPIWQERVAGKWEVEQ